MRITASIDRGHWANQLNKLSRVMGQTMDEVVEGQMRLALKDAIRLTPPFTAKPYKPLTESFGAQKKAGEESVRKGILKVFKPANSFYSMTEGGRNAELPVAIANAARRGDLNAIKAALPAVLSVQRMDAVAAVAEAGTYQGQRGRDGKPLGKTRRVLVHTGRVPAFEEPKKDAKPTSYGGLNKLYRAQIKNIGLAKAGWLKAATLVKMPRKFAPAWVWRHAGKAGGSGIAKFIHGVKATCVAGNGIPYIQADGTELRIIQRVLRNREANLYKQISMAMKAKAKRDGVKKYWTV